MDGENFNITLPAEASYPPPASFPSGIKGTRFRVQNMNTIPIAGPAGTPQSTEIDIQINEVPAGFLDTSTSALYVEGTYVATATLPVSSGIYFAASNANGGFIGGGASIFQRYQVYLNNSIISDDINEFGLTCYLMYLLNYNEEQRFRMSKILGFNEGYPSSTWGAALHGPSLNDRATITITGGTYTANNATTMSGTVQPNQYNRVDGAFWGVTASGSTPIVITLTQNYQFMLHLPGVLGMGNRRMMPLFCGPIRISLFVDNINNFYLPDFGNCLAGGTAAVGNGTTTGIGSSAVPAAFQFVNNQYFAVNSVWFHADFYKCDVNVFNALMAALPKENTFIFRTTAWTVSSAQITAGYSGQTDILVPPRRASIKSFYALPSPGLGQATVSGYNYGCCNAWGKYGWICPNLGNNTCLMLNGVQYPQQGTDPIARPAEMFEIFLETQRTWSDLANKPGISPQNYFVMDNINTVGLYNGAASSTAITAYNAYRNATNAGNQGANLWRQAITTTFRFVLSPGTSFTTNPYDGWNHAIGIAGANVGNGFTAPNGTSTNAAINSNTTMTDKTFIMSDALQMIPSYAHFLEGTSCCDRQNTWGGRSNLLLPYDMSQPLCNQFVWGYNLDQMTKPDVLTGTSSLTGNFFWRVNIVQPLLFSYSVYFVVVFDQLIVMDAALRTISVKF